MKRYAGIGSRDTPKDIQTTMSEIAYYLASEARMILVSGGARGADKAFETGCDAAHGMKDIWLPELGFNGSTSNLLPSKDAFIVAKRYVEHWANCGEWARSAHARNCHQILGEDLCTPVSFVICWTPEGELLGGTATALKIAMDKNVPILNLGLPHDIDVIDAFLSEHC